MHFSMNAQFPLYLFIKNREAEIFEVSIIGNALMLYYRYLNMSSH